MEADFKCPVCGKIHSYIMQNDVIVKTLPDKTRMWKLYYHFCGADMYKAEFQ
jgi:hypothetical protein